MNTLALLVLATIPHTIDPSFDRVELNHYYNNDGDHVLDQVIFWDWCPHRCDFICQGWRLHDSCSIYGDRLYVDTTRVRYRQFAETWTQYDPEALDRDRYPVNQRRGLKQCRQ